MSDEPKMRIPSSAGDDIADMIEGNLPGANEAYFPNVFPGRELLTRFEVIDAISQLSTMLLTDERHRVR